MIRMGDDRMVKAVVLGWVEQLERWDRVKGSRRKTVLYWKKLLRKGPEEMEALGEGEERSKGHKWQGDRPERRDAVREDRMAFVFVCDYCGKVCKSKAGLTIHTKRMHEESTGKKKFVCGKCKEVFQQEANLINHDKICGGVTVDGKVWCGKCPGLYAKSYVARHRRACGAAAAEGGVEEVVARPQARVY